ncbi:MAG TPA: hypothetical protein VEJ63_22680 [Planctomycetota bacterium]|nr:hypothetical protein [Planctomycetota bacterium]
MISTRMRGVSLLRVLALSVLMAAAASAEEAASRHGEAGAIGSNGVRQSVRIKINKLDSSKDGATLQLDLGRHSTSVEELIANKPTILLTIGAVPTMSGVANEKGVILGTQFMAKLVKKGLGIRITIRNQNLSALLSSLSNQPEHGHIDITIENIKPALLIPKDFEMDVKESPETLFAKAKKP